MGLGLVSGVPKLVNGVEVGATDFREFSVGVGIPSGITQFGLGADAPVTMEIENDVTEGNFFSMDDHGPQAWAFGYDAFFGKMDTGEMLARFFSTYFTAPRKNVGGVASLSGLIGQPEPSPDLDFWGGNQSLDGVGPFDIETNGVLSNDGSGQQPLDNANMQEAFQNGAWAWIRIRRVPNGGDPSRDDWTGTTWYGDIDDEPASPDGTSTLQVRVISGLAAIGWGVGQFGDPNKQQIAFLSYSGDPTVQAPPTPADFGTAWEPCDPAVSTVFAAPPLVSTGWT